MTPLSSLLIGHEIALTISDVQVINKGGVIATDLYTKPTDKHQYLYHTSCHPKGCKRSIPYPQALRLKQIFSTPASFENRAKDLAHFW